MSLHGILFDLCVTNKDKKLAIYKNLLESHVCSDEKCVCGGWKGDKTVYCPQNQRCLVDHCKADNEITEKAGVVVKRKFSTFWINKGSKKWQITCQKGQYWKCESTDNCSCFNKEIHHIKPTEVCQNKNEDLKCICELLEKKLEIPTGSKCIMKEDYSLESAKVYSFLECRYKFECISDSAFKGTSISYFNLETLKYQSEKPSADKIMKREEKEV